MRRRPAIRWLGWAVVALLAAVVAIPPGAVPAVLPGSSTHPTGAVWTTDVSVAPPGAAPLPGDFPVRLEAALVPRHADRLSALDAELAGASGSSRGYLSESQFEAEFSPSPEAVAAVEAYFARFGAHSLAVTPDRLGVGLTLNASGLSAALGVDLLRTGTSASGAALYTTSGVPSEPSELRGLVSGIGGLSNLANAGAHLDLGGVLYGGSRLSPAQFVTESTTGEPWFVGSDFSRFYDESALFPPSAAVANATFPSGEAVATILASGYNTSANADLPPYDPAAVRQYFNDTFPAGWPAPSVSSQAVTIAGVTPPPAGPLGALNDTTFDQTENALDLEMAGSLAPGATLVDFYMAGSLINGPGSLPVGDLADGFAQCLATALSHDYGAARLAAVTNSYGLPDLNDSLWNQELAHAAATGVTIVAASGDQGNAPQSLTNRFQGQWADWPASAAFASSGAVAVGGVSVTPDGSPNGSYGAAGLTVGYDAGLRGIASQSVWYDTLGGTGSYSGSEGGLSEVFPEPSWQLHSAAQPAIVNATLTQGGLGSLMRAVPDIALIANATIVYDAEDAANNTTYFQVVEGTSIASPVLAGLLASLSAVAGHPLGFLDPELYRVASFFSQNPGTAGSPLQDVTLGANYLFSAAPGWDPATGWGGLAATAWLAADANATVSQWNYTGPVPGLPLPSAPPSATVSPVLLLVFGVALASAAVLAIWAARPRSSTARPLPPLGPPVGAYAPPPPGSSLGTFPCPYCGTTRPAEPVRCPGCGAY